MTIPDFIQAEQLWDKYNLSEHKRKHVTLVARVARFLGRKCQMLNDKYQIDEKLLIAGALLHDIDKNIPRLPGEQHPDTAVRILKEEGMEEVAQLVKTHPLHAILDSAITPKTWEEKLLFLADKMVKNDIVTVDQRFSLWRQEPLPKEAVKLLDIAYPYVKKLESDIFTIIDIPPEKVKELA